MNDDETTVTVRALKAGERTEDLVRALNENPELAVEESETGLWQVHAEGAETAEEALTLVRSTLDSADEADDWDEYVEVGGDD